MICRSYIIKLRGKLFGHLAVRLQDFRSELGALLRVLHDSWHLDRACPVDVVEALTEADLLQYSLLNF